MDTMAGHTLMTAKEICPYVAFELLEGGLLDLQVSSCPTILPAKFLPVSLECLHISSRDLV